MQQPPKASVNGAIPETGRLCHFWVMDICAPLYSLLSRLILHLLYKKADGFASRFDIMLQKCNISFTIYGWKNLPRHWRDTLNGVSRQFYSPAASSIASQCYSAYAA
jgi:hypothetical protein